MDLTTILGLTTAMAVFIGSVIAAFADVGVMLDFKALALVVGGTLAASMIAFPFSDFRKLLKVFIFRLLGKNTIDFNRIIEDIATLANADINQKRAFHQAVEEVQFPFLKDAAGVLFWIRADVSPEELRDLLETRAETHFKEYMREANFFRTIAKFPPSFGLIGTTMGMIALLQGLGGGAGNLRNTIGPAMAIALLTTLYGLVFSSFILTPVAENLTDQTHDDQRARRMVIEAIMLIQAQKPAKYVVEHVKSYLLPSKRKDDEAA